MRKSKPLPHAPVVLRHWWPCMAMLQKPLLAFFLSGLIIRISRMPEDRLDRMRIGVLHRLAVRVVQHGVGSSFEQPVGHHETTPGRIDAEDRATGGSFGIYAGAAFDQELYVLPLVLLDECVEQKRLVIGSAGIRITTMIEQDSEIDGILLLRRPYHCIAVETSASVLRLERLLRVRIGSGLEHRAQSFWTLAVDRPRQQWHAAVVAAEDEVGVHAFVVHEAADFGRIAALGGDGQGLGARVGEGAFERGLVAGARL